MSRPHHPTQIALAATACINLWVYPPFAFSQAALQHQGASNPDALKEGENPNPNPTPSITITGKVKAQADALTGFGDTPLRELPASVTVISSKDLQNTGMKRLSDLTKLDPSTTESYNAIGYWDFLEVRGFVLDNRYNFRREGLPISAQTSIPLDNKEQIEILKGTSGVQAGTSSPGGLVNYAVKRPTNQDLRSFKLDLTPRGGISTALDIGGKMGEDKGMGYRFNAVHEELRPALGNAKGQRDMVSLAMDKRLGSQTMLEAEIELSKQAQPSQAAFSLLDRRLPTTIDPKLNLNNQTWSQPVVMQGTTSSLKLSQVLSENWSLTAQLGVQQLRSNDREAYPSGCSTSMDYQVFCTDGTYTLYDYRSEGEKRQANSGKISALGKISLGAFTHRLTLEHLRGHQQERLPAYAFNDTGSGNIWGTAVTNASPSASYAGTNRDERSSEWMISDAITWENWRFYAGYRMTQLLRSSVDTDGTSAVAYSQTLGTPWVGLSANWSGAQWYASAGQGVESYVTPNKSGYALAGQVLPAAKSRQIEAGVRGGDKDLAWSWTWFDIQRPAVFDSGSDYQIDGKAQHRGLEAQAQQGFGALKLSASAMWIHARRLGSFDPTYNGLKPTNVPNNTLRLQSHYAIAGTAWTVQNIIVRDGERAVTPDNTVFLPAWWRWDLAASHTHTLSGKLARHRLSIENLTHRAYWKGAPTQFGNYFLYPGAPRTVRWSTVLEF